MEAELFNMFERNILNDLENITPQLLLNLIDGFTEKQDWLIAAIKNRQTES